MPATFGAETVRLRLFNAKLDRLRGFMARQGLDALVLLRQENFAWLTGGRGHISVATELSTAAVVVTEAGVHVVTNAIEAPRFETEELAGLPLTVQAYSWYRDSERDRLIRELAGAGPLGSDVFLPGSRLVAADLAPLRWTLLPEEQAWARQMGQALAGALEDAARHVEPGMTEYEIAADVAARVVAAGMDPVVNLVATDERLWRYRHPLPTGRRLHRHALLVVCGRARGLVLSCSRMVHFGEPPVDLRRRVQAVAAIDAALISGTRPGVRVADLFARTQALYAELGFPDEWERHHQGGLAGYLSREYRATPDSPYTVAEGQLFAWNPTVPGAKSEDTILVTEEGSEVLTETGTWPYIELDGIRRPDLLVL